MPHPSESFERTGRGRLAPWLPGFMALGCAVGGAPQAGTTGSDGDGSPMVFSDSAANDLQRLYRVHVAP